MLCGETTHACEPVQYDFFVNAARLGTGIGTLQDPFRTITEALYAAGLLEGEPRRVYVGPGVYDESLGERFPIEIPMDVLVEGAGSDKTIISGLGFSQMEVNRDVRGEYMSTIVMGHEEFVRRIANVSLRPGNRLPQMRTFGVFCKRGNAPQTWEAPVQPNAMIHGVDIAGAYTSGVDVSIGCNLALTSSKISDSEYGVTAEGCFGQWRYGYPALELGDGTPGGGNEFENIKASDNWAAAVYSRSCARVSATYNYFHDSNVGILLGGAAAYVEGADHAIIENNRFEDLDHAGVFLHGGRVVVDSLSGNRFERISTELHEDPPVGVGLASVSYDDEEPLPQVLRARNNTFRLNDVAVNIQGVSPLTLERIIDFGTTESPGGNVFSCNSTGATSWIAGGDVRLDVPNADGVTLPFAGNMWDHLPPSRGETSESADANGADIAMSAANRVEIDTSNASLAAEACPGRP
jgi:hypothetical protein